MDTFFCPNGVWIRGVHVHTFSESSSSRCCPSIATPPMLSPWQLVGLHVRRRWLIASESEGGSTYSSLSQSSRTQLMTVWTSAGIGTGGGWGEGDMGSLKLVRGGKFRGATRFGRDRDRCSEIEGVTIPYSTLVKINMDSWFVSFSTHVPTTNAKSLTPFFERDTKIWAR